jgi:hypothetical protein
MAMLSGVTIQLSSRRGSITPAQRSYLQGLCNEAFVALYETWTLLRLDAAHLDQCDAAYASTCITHLLAAKARGWTPPVPSADEELRSERTRARVSRIRELRAAGHRCSCQGLDGDESRCDMHSRMLDLARSS